MAELVRSIDPLRNRLLEHQVYHSLQSVEDLRIFMEHHILAVWDFMLLLKTLQAKLTCVSVPWFPKGDPEIRKLVNEMVLAEESDTTEGGQVLSHFEMYLEVMQETGADTVPVSTFLSLLRDGKGITSALAEARVPRAARYFVTSTWRTVEKESSHQVAAAFTFGREDLIRDMYRALLVGLRGQFLGVFARFEGYLRRLVDTDGNRHRRLSYRMLCTLCGDDCAKWDEAEETARKCLLARLALWDAVVRQIARSRELMEKADAARVG